MKNILLIISFIAFHISINAQSDPIRPNHQAIDQDSSTKEINSKDSDEDAMEINRDRPVERKIINTGDDQPVQPDTSQIMLPEIDPKQSNGLSMRNGTVMSNENGTLRMLKKDTVLSNGIRVKSDGTVITPDGSKFNMQEGQFIDMSGNMTLTKDSIQKRKQ